MKKILVIESSPRGDASISRQLTRDILAQLKTRYPENSVTVRDLTRAPLAHLSPETVGAFFAPPEKHDAAQKTAIAASDQATEELLAADILVIGVPMWNFGIPSVLKAWIDHVVRAGKTFSYTAQGPVGLIKGKSAILAVARGGVYSEGHMKTLDFQTGYLKTILGFIGITDVECVIAEGLAFGEEAAKKSLESAKTQLTDVVRKAA